MKTDVAGAPKIRGLFKACIIVFVICMIMAIVANSGGVDARIFFGYLSFLILIFISLPLHLITSFLVILNGKKYAAWSQYSWFYVYIFIYLSIHMVVLGPVLYQPVKDIVGDLTYNFSHKKEIALINEIRGPQNPEIVKRLIEQKADVNLPDKAIGFTPLMWAAREGNTDIIRILLDAGADPFFVNKAIKGSPDFSNSVDVSGMGAITLAGWATKEQARRDSVMLFLEKGVKPDTGSLLGACLNGDMELLKAQLERGADPDVVDNNNTTCMHMAAMGNRPAIITYLLEKGADTDIHSRYGLTPLDTAIERYREKAILELLKAGQRTERADSLKRYLDQAPESLEKEAIRRLLEKDKPDHE
jgi:ankyrin repeat protein